MKPSLVSPNAALALSSVAFLTGLARLILEVRFVPEIVRVMAEDQPGQVALVMAIPVTFFGGWLWALLAVARGRRGGLLAALLFSLFLALAWGLPTLVSFCPTPCATAWPLTDLVTWSNVIAGSIAAIAAGLALNATAGPAGGLKEEPPAPPSPPMAPHARWVAAFTALSWLGGYLHNRVDLPHLTLLSPENSVPALLSLALFLAWRRLSGRRMAALALLGWALVQLVGGALSVLPLDFLPFEPAQTVLHYLMHIVYAAAQLPLIAVLLRQIRAGEPGRPVSSVSA